MPESLLGAAWHRLRRPQGSAKGFLQLVSGTAIGQAAVFISAPILTRLYAVGDFGQLAAYAAAVGIFSAAVTLRYEQAAMLARDERSATHLVVAGLASTVLVVAAMLALSCASIPLLDRFSGWATLKAHRALVALGLIGAGWNQVLVFWALRDKFYGDVARTRVAQSLSAAGVQLAAGFLRIGALGLLFGDVCGRYSGSVTLARLGWRRNREHLRHTRARDVWRTACAYWRFPVFLSWSGIVNAAGVSLPVLFMTSYYGPFVAGEYGLVDRVAAVPSALIGRAASQLFAGEASEIARRDPSLLPGLFLRRALWLGVPAVVGGALYALAAPWLFATVFGAKWALAGQFARMLAPATAVAFVASPLGQTLVIAGRPALSSLWDIGRLCAVLATIGLGVTMHLTPARVLAAYSATSVLAYGVGMSACYWAARHPRPLATEQVDEALLASQSSTVE